MNAQHKLQKLQAKAVRRARRDYVRRIVDDLDLRNELRQYSLLRQPTTQLQAQ